MKKDTLKQMSFKEKEQTLSAIFKEYQKAKLHLKYDDFSYQPAHTLMVYEDNYQSNVTYEQKLLAHIAKQNNYRRYIVFVEEAMIRLSPTQRLIIENEFIKESSPYWWESYFSRSTYYRHKNEAMNTILPLLFS